ncbi:putative protein kinase subdomain-containing protein PKL CAK Fmp29 [Lyophyllum shimeji]|uniref:Uncharacterized protein n=1 Tax=Lyophyllum shimeji TaxID=47721 RepID=A0A9P3PIQ4_LYOSH|nr:putative protein kinase subdomain-containing protein PKL CAK Fmp29 [Lyophyllum shimeji]
MRQAEHRDDRTYAEYYASTNPGTDGQGSYFGSTRRTLVNERFLALTVAWNPELYQSLPAGKMFELEKRPDFAAIEEQLLELCFCDDSSKVAEKRKRLQAQNSDVGRAVLSDLIALYKQTSEVEARPGLEPEKCCCDPERRKRPKSNSHDAKRSRHVYGCVKKHLQATRSFGEFGFMCNTPPGGRATDVHCWMRATSRPRKSHKSCRPATSDEVVDDDGEEEYNDESDVVNKMSGHIATLGLRPPSPCSTASSLSTTSSPTIASPSLSYASWSDDQGECIVFDSTSYSSGDPVQSVSFDKPTYCPPVVGAWSGDNYASYPSIAHLPACPNGGYYSYNNSCLAQAAESLNLASPEAQLGHAASGYDWTWASSSVSSEQAILDVADHSPSILSSPVRAVCQRSQLDVDRGPYESAEAALVRGAHKELAYLERFGQPLLPFQPLSREGYRYQKQSPLDHIKNLERYLLIASSLVPRDPALCHFRIRHPDLRQSDIIVSRSPGSNWQVVCLLDWHASILPLFLLAGPSLPENFDDLDKTKQSRAEELYRRRLVHYHYVKNTEEYNELHYAALTDPVGMLRRRLFYYASDPWEGETLALKVALIEVTENWKTLTGGDAPCPVVFDAEDVRETMELDKVQREADERLEALRNMIGFGLEGWVSNEHYETAMTLSKQVKEDALAAAESAKERDEILENWFLDNIDEEKYM